MGREETPETEVERRKRSKEVYKALVRAVDYQSGRNQPPLAKKTSVIQILHGAGYGCYGLKELHRKIHAARRNSDLFQVEDERGNLRLGVNNADALAEKVGSHIK